METIHSVFISATSADLGSYRKIAKEALLTNGIMPIEQTDFPPDFGTIGNILKRKIGACDAVICLIGFSYGAEPLDRPVDELRRSYTQLEYDAARRLGKPVFLFVATDDCVFDSRPVEDPERKQLQLAHRKAITESNQRWETFSNPEQLRQRIAHVRLQRTQAGHQSPKNLPYQSLGSLFKGREGLMNQLREKLLSEMQQEEPAAGNAKAARHVLCGLGGIGKTRMAVEYAERFRSDYTALLFVTADSPDNLRRSLASLTGPMVLNLRDVQQGPEEDRIAAALRWLADHPRWCMILDNVDSYEAQKSVAEVLVRLSGGHVLITSRLSESEWSHDVEPLHLDVLAPADAKCFLLERTSRLRRRMPTDESDAASLLRELDGLALALEQAGAFIERQRCSIGEYLKRWKAGESRVREWSNATLTHYPNSLAVTWDTTMRAISPEAAALLRILSFFAPAPTPDSILATDVAKMVLTEAVSPDARHSAPFPDEALVELTAFSMVRRFDDQGVPCFSLHCVVQEITRKRTSEIEQRTMLQRAVQLLVAYAPKDSYRFEAWSDWRLLIAHAETLWCHHRPPVSEGRISVPESDWNPDLIGALALYYLGQERYPDAIPLQRIVLNLLSSHPSTNEAAVLLAKNDLALMLDSEANREEKESLYREALAGRRRVHGEVSEETAETLHNLGDFLKNSGRLDESEASLRSCMEIFTKVCGPFHWRTLMTEMGIARVLSLRGHHDAAVALVRSNLDKKRQHLAPFHVDTLDSISTLANWLEIAGDPEAVEPLRRELVEGYRQTWGPGHQNTLGAFGELACFLLLRGRPDEAIAQYSSILKIQEDTIAPDRIRSLVNFAYTLRKVGNAAGAEEFDRRAVAYSETLFGAQNTLSVHRRNNLALTLTQLGKFDEARAILQENCIRPFTAIENLTPRLPYLSATLELTGGNPSAATPHFATLRAHLAQPALPVGDGIQVPWDLRYFLDALAPKLPPGAHDLLVALLDILNARCQVSPPADLAAQLAALDRFTLWREA